MAKEKYLSNCGGIELPVKLEPRPDDKKARKTSKYGSGVKDTMDEAKHPKAAK